MEVSWRDVLIKQAENIMTKGGKLEFIVLVRDRKRFPIIHTYPDNQIICKTETLID